MENAPCDCAPPPPPAIGGPQQRSHSRPRHRGKGNRMVGTLALTLTLSPGEREQRQFRVVILRGRLANPVAGLRQSKRIHFQRRGQGFPLSSGERAGVRGDVKPIILVAADVSRLEKLLWFGEGRLSGLTSAATGSGGVGATMRPLRRQQPAAHQQRIHWGHDPRIHTTMAHCRSCGTGSTGPRFAPLSVH
jgi:hypothetical protein